MPNLITHTLFTEDVLKALDNPALNARHKLVITGGQGPDFLFFHHSVPSKLLIPTRLRKYGTLFHEEHVNGFYASALNSIRHEKNAAIREDMIAYTVGHLCHWAMDSTFHPLIYYRTGNCKGKSAWSHHQYEALLDAAMLQYKKGQTIATYDPSTQCLSDKLPVARAIARIYRPAIQAIFQETIEPHEFKEVLDDWKRAQQIFRDPKNRKKAWIKPLEKMLGMEHILTGFSVPNVCEDNVDIGNLLHDEWKHPSSGEIRHESVFDLWQEAMDKALMAIDLFYKALADKNDEPAFLDFLDDRNYDIGIPGNPAPVFFELADLSD